MLVKMGSYQTSQILLVEYEIVQSLWKQLSNFLKTYTPVNAIWSQEKLMHMSTHSL